MPSATETYTSVALGITLAAVLAPVAINQQLRRTYEQTLSHWRSKITRPDRVIIGDSLAAGGGDFGHFGDINLGVSGMVTEEIAAQMRTAQAYHPRHIVVIAGINDIFLNIDDPARLTPPWRAMLADPAVIVTLIPPTRNTSFNARIDRLNTMISTLARQSHRKVIAIPGITGPDGLRLPESTVDNVHLSPSAYDKWRAALDTVIG
jgi:hypothetical protein